MATVGSLIIKLQASTAEFDKKISRAQKKLMQFNRAVSGIGRVAGRAALGIAGLAAVTVKYAMEQEKTEKLLDAALSATGQSLDKYSQKLRNVARDIQANTVYGDESILVLMTQATNLGVSADKMEETAKQAIGLATALNMDLNTALRYTALATQGEYTMLRRYIPELRTTTDAAAQLAIVQRVANAGYQQAQDETKTLTGQLAQLKNRFGDVAERIGKAIIPMVSKWMTQLNGLAKRIENISTQQIESFVQKIITLGKWLGGIWLASKVVAGITGFVKMIKNVTMVFKTLVAVSKLAYAGIIKGAAMMGGAFNLLLAGPIAALVAGFALIIMKANAAKAAMEAIERSSRDFGALVMEERRARESLRTSRDLTERKEALEKLVAVQKSMLEQLEKEAGIKGISQPARDVLYKQVDVVRARIYQAEDRLREVARTEKEQAAKEQLLEQKKTNSLLQQMADGNTIGALQ